MSTFHIFPKVVKPGQKNERQKDDKSCWVQRSLTDSEQKTSAWSK